MTSIQLAHLLAQPTLLKGVYYETHKALVLQQVLWYSLTAETWRYPPDDSEPDRARNFRRYLEALEIE